MSTENGIVIWLGNRKWAQKKNRNGICLGNRKCCAESQNLKLLFNAPMFSFMYTINMKKLIIETTVIIWWIYLKCYLYLIGEVNAP